MARAFHMPASFGLRLAAIGLMSMLAMLAAMPAGAQDLDPDSPPPARDYVSCGHFDSQESAQELLDSGTLDELGRQSLDGDGDGIACEDASHLAEPASGTELAPASVAQLPNTGSGTLATSGTGNALIAGLMVTSGALLVLGRRLANR